MTRDEAIEAGARALWARFSSGDESWEEVPLIRDDVAAVLDAIGWTPPIGYLAAEPGALIGAYPTLDQAARSGWGEAVYAVVPVQGPSKLDANEGGE